MFDRLTTGKRNRTSYKTIPVCDIEIILEVFLLFLK
nr:MAG TPA: hypothetical protein [Caudoviricetes sp.]DAY15310.1 MAG TPA: hypothetical protein [Caudoviricetes sp.]